MNENIGLECFDIPAADFEKVCRVCLIRCEKLTSIHKIVFTYGHSLEGTIEEVLLTRVLERYCDVKVRRNDAKPQNICEKCLNLLANAFNILSLFRLSNLFLDKILRKHSLTIGEKSQSDDRAFTSISQQLLYDKIRDRIESSIGKTSHLASRNNSPEELKLQESKMLFEFDLPKAGEDDSITSPYSPMDGELLNTSFENSTIKDNVKNHTADQLNWRRWDHTYCVKPDEFSNKVISACGKNKPRKPRIRLKKNKIMSELQLKKMVLQYQRKNEIFSCKLCEGHIFQGMDKVIDHMNTIHPLTDICILCEKKCKKNRILPHVASHAKKGKLVCFKCSIYFKDKESLEAHNESEGHKNFTLKCHICSRAFRWASRLKMHIEEVHLKKSDHKAQCFKCGRVMEKSNLNKHLRSHKEMKERKSFLCERCAQSFTTATALKQHVLITHEGQVHLKRRQRTPSIQHDPRFYKPDEKVYACDYCPRTISTKVAFFKHRISHPECEDVVCPTCCITLPSPMEYRRHKEAVHSTYRCENCHKGWPTKIALYMHKITVHRPRRYKCPFCSKSFRTRHTLKCHKLTHTTEKPFSCQLCDKKFKQSAQVTQHILCVHSEKRRHACHICSKSFLFNYSLKAHMRYHMGYRPFSCPYCTKCFIDTVSRHKHVKHFHPEQMEDFLIFKKLHQNDEVRLVDGLPSGTEDLDDADQLAVSSLENKSHVTSSKENNEESPKNVEDMINEFVFAPGGGSILNSLLEITSS